MTTFLRVGLLGSLLCLSGCATRLGPGTIKNAHRPYNDSVVQTLNEQLLLNLVRLKYRDNPYFIEVSSITAQQTLETTAAASGSLPFITSKLRDIGVGGGVLYSDSPTIAFQPLQGEDFLKKLMAPIPMEGLLKLTQSGWSVSRVFRIAVEQANHLHNAPSASGPTPEDPPEYEDFKNLSLQLRELQKKQALDVVLEGEEVAILFDESRVSSADRRRLISILGGDPGRNYVVVSARPRSQRDSDEVYLQTRSLIGALFFLSHNVEVPEEHIKKGLVTVTKNPDGSEFDWCDVSGDLMSVKNSPTPPTNAFVKVHYRGTWFYVPDNDLKSKSTFMLISQLFNLLAGDVKQAAPVLTIPVR